MKLREVDPLDYTVGKKLLLGGGQFMNQFMIVNLLSIDRAINPPIPCDYRARVIQKTYSGEEEFTPWLASWSLAELPKGWARKAIGTYRADFDGTIVNITQ